MAIRAWKFSQVDKEQAAFLAESCELNPFLALLLVERGITEPEQVLPFFAGEETDDPYQLADMDIAVERIMSAVHNGEKIMVYGDYDVDGITSAVLLYSYLKEQGALVDYRLPTRQHDGYGLHKGLIDEFAQQGINLLITVDNGITAVEEVAYASQLGIDVVVTDHHQPQAELPKAVAVVDPHRADCTSGYVNYAGVGIAFLLVCALEGDDAAVMETYGDLLALGMLADVMSLTGTARSLVRRGLAELNHLRRPGIKALAQIAGVIDKDITASRVVFTLAPRLNATGRMRNPALAAALLLEQDPVRAAELAAQVQDCNIQRQSVEMEILQEIEADLEAHPEKTADRVLVLAGEGWHVGVIGILAARLTERYGKPTVLLSIDGEQANGSGRSIAGFSLFDALSATVDTVTGFGGHELAAGVHLPTANIADFREKLNAYAAENFQRMPVPTLDISLKLRPAAIGTEMLGALGALEPFGNGNPTPVFALCDMRLDNVTPLGADKHLRLSFSKGDARLSVLKFHTSYKDFPLTCGDTFHLAVTLERNVYKGIVNTSVLLKDIRYAQTDETVLLDTARRFDAVMRRETKDLGEELLLSREKMGTLYRYLVQHNGFVGTLEQLHHLLENPEISMLSVRILVEIWRQAGLCTVKDYGDTLKIAVVPNAQKTDLTQTPLWQFLK